MRLVPEVHDTAAWDAFVRKWVAEDDGIKEEARAQKRPRTEPANAPTEDPTIEGAHAQLLRALHARQTALEPVRSSNGAVMHSHELKQLEDYTTALSQRLELLNEARREDFVAVLAEDIDLEKLEGSDDSLEVRAEPVHSPTAAAAADSAACSSSSAAAPAGPAFRGLSADPAPASRGLSADADPAPSVGCSASADAAPPAAAPASPREALERKLLQLLRSLPGSEAERRVELCYRVAAARAAHA